MLYLSLRIPFQGVSRLPGFLSNHRFLRQNSYFLRQYPVLPRFLGAVPRLVRGGGGGGGGWEAYASSYVVLPGRTV